MMMEFGLAPEIMAVIRKRFSDAQWAKAGSDYLPTASDGDFIASLMNPETEPGKFASWIAPPKAGIDNKPGDFEYVKIENS